MAVYGTVAEAERASGVGRLAIAAALNGAGGTWHYEAGAAPVGPLAIYGDVVEWADVR